MQPPTTSQQARAPEGKAPTAFSLREREDMGQNRPSILLVDDDPHVLEVQVRMLRGMGYTRLSTAADGKEALLQLEHDPNSAQLIICDLNMPVMDGLEFLQLLNASPYRASIVLLSGTSLRLMHSVQKLLGAGRLTILGVLTKPAAKTDLQALLDRWKPGAAALLKAQAHVLTLEDLCHASRDQRWVLHFQPQVDLRSGALVGMEALVRYQHPEHGLIFPNQFIDAAESCEAMDTLTDWVMKAALGQQAYWQAQGLRLRMAMNVSMKSLSTNGLWRRVRVLAQSFALAPQDITLELTESRVATFPDTALENLIRLQLLGFTLSIDDFGTGQSSLAQLRDLPFSELKIDRGFVHDARHNQIIRPILEGSLAIARGMQMKSVAEGIETTSDWRLLRELDCELAQGYFVAKPMRAEHILDWFATWKGRLPDLLGS
jgi:EAL domain-containing protein (putative c-di-GMP-specific phosphodiesterase class I)/CheY-like chemotaxis protein